MSLSLVKSGFAGILMRTTWVAILLAALFTLAASIPIGYARLMTVCAGELCAEDQLTPQAAAQLAAAGLSLHVHALYIIGQVLLLALVNGIIAVLIYGRKPDDHMAWYTSIMLITFGVFVTQFVGELATINQGWLLLTDVMSSLAWVLLGGFLCLFPDGRFIPRWAWLLFAGWLWTQLPYYLNLVYPLPVWAVTNPGNWAPALQFVAFGGLLGAGVYAQLFRYRRISTPAQRQQTKWVVYGLTVAVLAIMGLHQLPASFAPHLHEPGTLSALLFSFLLLVTVLLIPVTIGLAILRYRLWDIDLIIRRTLIYSLLTGLLGLTYLGSVIAFQQLFSGFIDPSSPLVAVISTLLIAALFNPLRRRVQNIIDRRFYRRQVDAARVLASFAAVSREKVELDQLTAELLNTVQETMQPAYISLWLKETK